MQFKDMDLFKNFGYAINKIFDRVHISNNPLDSIVEKFVQFETFAESKGSEMLPVLLKSIKEKKLVTFDYTAFTSVTICLDTYARWATCPQKSDVHKD
jgi:hypothetical protein